MKYRLHGANPQKVYEQKGMKYPDRVIDFSTNTNVLKSDISFDINIKDLASTYPCDENLEIRNAIASRLEVSIDSILVTNGINEIIYLICSVHKNVRVGILAPTYPEYKKAALAYGHDVILFDSIDQINGVDIVFICNPNNPTGSFIETRHLEKLSNRLQDALIVVDESYIDFMVDNVKSVNVSKFKNVMLLRSLTKIYHLSGLRIGYTLADKNIIEKFKSVQPTWSVNGIAQEIGLRFINDTKFVEKTKSYYEKETPKLIESIRSLGYKVIDTTVNFFLVEVDDDEKIIDWLLSKGIVVRHTRNYHKLNGKYIRIACKSKEDNSILIDELGRFRNENNTY